MSRNKRWSDDQFIEAVASSYSITATLDKIGLKPTGGNFRTFRYAVSRLGVDISHFTGNGHLKGKSHGWTPSISLTEILVQRSTYHSGRLKERLIREHLLLNKCSECDLTQWQEKALVLHMDHINGDPCDNRLENLRLLCPNCHSQTPTYCGRNKRKK